MKRVVMFHRQPLHGKTELGRKAAPPEVHHKPCRKPNLVQSTRLSTEGEHWRETRGGRLLTSPTDSRFPTCTAATDRATPLGTSALICAVAA